MGQVFPGAHGAHARWAAGFLQVCTSRELGASLSPPFPTAWEGRDKVSLPNKVQTRFLPAGGAADPPRSGPLAPGVHRCPARDPAGLELKAAALHTLLWTTACSVSRWP